jgi:RecA DNA recombination protein
VSRALKLLDPELVAQLVTAERLRDRQGSCSTGIGAIDDLLGGGWPRGALSELCGRRSSGRTSVLLASLATALAAGHAAALVDVDGTLDPRGAAAAGVPLERLLWVRAGQREALKAADLLISAGGFGLVALDLGEGSLGRRHGSATGAPARAQAPRQPRSPAVPDAAWVRLKHAAERQRTAVLVAAPRPTVGAFAASAIDLLGLQPLFDSDGPPLLVALRTAVEVRRHRRSNDVAATRTNLIVKADRARPWEPI